MKGRKIRSISDPALAREHAAGSTVTLIQPVLHQAYGLINMDAQRYWPVHLRSWRGAHLRLQRLDKRLLRLPLLQSNDRMLREPKLIADLYMTGIDIVLNAVLTLQYLALDIEKIAGLPPGDRLELTERYRQAANSAGLVDPKEMPGWDKIVELHKYRDAVFHPGVGNTYGADDGSWKVVPAAWFASGRALEASESGLHDVEAAARAWEQNKSRFDRPGELQVTRGMRSLEPAKKAPTRKLRRH